MGFYFHLFGIGTVISLLLGVVPLLLVHIYKLPDSAVIIACCNTFSWFLVATLLLRQRNIFLTVRRAIDIVGVPDLSGSISKVIEDFARESARYYRAAYSSRLERRTKDVNLSDSLWRIVCLAYNEFNARSVELSLVDEESGLCSQAMIIGQPKTTESQTMLASEGKRATTILADAENGIVVVKPVAFAGTVFGALRVELQEGVELTSSDRHVLHLLAGQGGILLVNARFTEEVLRMKRLGEETTKAKTGFLANLSHEIRGPLGIILNGVELVLDGLCGELTSEQRETLTMIKESGTHLLDLVNDVLDYAKVEAGKVQATPVTIAVNDLLEDLTAVVRGQAQAKKHELILEEVDPSLGIVCDKRHARQMLINFLTNAVKYTPNGGKITVTTKRFREKSVKISVADTGIGIPESERSKVFGAFERIENKYTLSQMGTGLGMSLTSKLAEVNNGAVGFESEEGRGSTFWVILPGAEIEQAADAAEENGEAGSVQGRGERILLVDAENENRQMLERYLKGQGFEVLVAKNASEVIKALRDKKVDAAVVENELPEMTGENMIATIRSSPFSRSVPIILLSSRAFVFDIERFLKLGVDRCLSKPVPLLELAKTARRLIDETRMLAEKQSAAGEAPAPQTP